MRKSSVSLLFLIILSAFLPGCAAFTFLDVAMIAASATIPVAMLAGAKNESGEIASGGSLANIEEMPCPTVSMKRAEVVAHAKEKNLNGSCILEKIESYYSSPELREEVARRGPPQFASRIRTGYGPVCRIDPVYVSPVSQEVSDEIYRDCKLREGGVREAAGPKRGEGGGAETRRAK